VVLRNEKGRNTASFSSARREKGETALEEESPDRLTGREKELDNEVPASLLHRKKEENLTFAEAKERKASL